MPNDTQASTVPSQAEQVASVVTTGNVSVMGGAAGGTSPAASTTIVVPTTAPTPGYKTTEFWTVLAVVIATFLNQSGVLGQFQVDPQIVYSGMGLVLAYVATRWGLKAQGANGANTLSTLLTTLQKTQTPVT